MKEKDYDNENLVSFRELAEKIKSFADSELDEDEIIEDLLIDGGFAQLFSQILSEKLAEPYEPVSEEQLLEEIADNYFVLIKELGIEKFSFFRFANYDYCREVIIDGKKYDLDGEFCHDDLDATGALCAIDCLIADLEHYDDETILKSIEKTINMRNK